MCIILRVNLAGIINFNEQVFINFQPPIDGINEEGQLTLSVCIGICGALYLSMTKLNTIFGQYVSGLLYIHVSWKFHDNINPP
ncbi:hypothetical protein D3C71_1961060 [compost metagenome]